MSKQDFISLYEKFLSGQCTDEEKQLLESHYSEIKLMDNEWDNTLGDEEAIKAQIIAKMQSELDFNKPIEIIKKRSNAWLKYAASIIFLLSAGLFLWHYREQKTRNNQSVNNILPGKNQAYLTLSNGQSIILNNTKNGQIGGASGVIIQKISDSILSYRQNNNTNNNIENTIIPDSNSLTVPRGGIYQTILSDGTKVWLNSASSIKYPVAFMGKERRVALTGEAYFEVAKNRKMPFKVAVNGMEVLVLGTHFNVMGYPEDKTIKTTLLEGSVSLHSTNNNTHLIPGQQGIFNASDFSVSTVNTDDVVAWKEGYFVFDNESIESTMQKISRWYNVEVVFENKKSLQNQHSFGGTISRHKNIDIVLKALEATGSVHFKITGRRITVMD
ncbi:FecR family protein [Mucilaginibacter sp. cycad4]|uniref:FecR family protein n=1 Tax=Mucilaginibacter sp. cycad4 TaxID=3342096 RepID=UPI002AAB03D6|nr:FecR family protein [Mucilaginibacter gossypii]WPV02944.1 FecR family protein [Mucilaginibacter gossypii]